MKPRPFWYLRRRRGEIDASLDEELRVHFEMRVDDLVAQGMAPDAARREALRQFGDLDYTRRYCRTQDERKDAGMRWHLIAGELAQDLRHGIRQIVRNRGLAAIVIVTLALGIGANTALFSIFNSLILRPLPVRDPGSLALLANGGWSYPIWNQLKAVDTDLFDGALAWSSQRFDLSTRGADDIVDGAYVSGRFFETLGVTAIRGRMLNAADDGAAPDGPVAVISDRLWRERYAAAADIVGRTVNVQRVPFTIAGVMPAGFFGTDVGRKADVMLSFASEPLIRGRESRLAAKSSRWLQIMVRLKPGQSVEQATAAVRALDPPIVLPWTRNAGPLTFEAATTGNSALRRRFATPLKAMVGAVGLVLLVACGNIASLMLARTLSRRREFSVRLALGSSRWRIARLLLVESLIVAVLGAALGMLFAAWGSALLVQQLSTWQSSVSLDLAIDARVLAFTAVLTCLSAVIAGVVPALGFTRVAPDEALRASGRGIAGDGRFYLRGALVVAQIALSCVLVVGAGLFLRTFVSLNSLPLGFVPEPLLVMEANLQSGGAAPESRLARVERLREAAASVPGVRSASVSAIRLLPGANTGWSTGLIGFGNGPAVRTDPDVWMNATTPGWFSTMGIPIESGRDFEPGDRLGSRTVAIVSETFVRRFLNGESPIGKQLRLGFDPLSFEDMPARGELAQTRYEIVGVAGDAAYTTPREGMVATVYFPVAQRNPAEFWSTLVITVNAAPGQRGAVERSVSAALTRVDPAIGFSTGTFDQLVDATVTQERLIAMLSGFFGGLALLLAAVGLYGLVAHSVRARQTEIGLRRALGAASSSIVRLVLERVGLLMAAGLALGLAASFWAARFVGSLLYQLDARDPVTFAGAALVLVAIGVLAAMVPARRAARIDPLAALRND